MRNFEESGISMDAIVDRFKIAIIPMVERHRSAGQVLTWRLMHEVECEGVEAIKKTGDLDPSVIRMLVASPHMGFPRLNDQPVDLEGWEVIPVLYSAIHKEYRRMQ